jgi:hypothetical protein
MSARSHLSCSTRSIGASETHESCAAAKRSAHHANALERGKTAGEGTVSSIRAHGPALDPCVAFQSSSAHGAVTVPRGMTETMQLDHLFAFVADETAALHEVARLGLRETYRRVHPGQGTVRVGARRAPARLASRGVATHPRVSSRGRTDRRICRLGWTSRSPRPRVILGSRCCFVRRVPHHPSTGPRSGAGAFSTRRASAPSLVSRSRRRS